MLRTKFPTLQFFSPDVSVDIELPVIIKTGTTECTTPFQILVSIQHYLLGVKFLELLNLKNILLKTKIQLKAQVFDAKDTDEQLFIKPVSPLASRDQTKTTKSLIQKIEFGNGKTLLQYVYEWTSYYAGAIYCYAWPCKLLSSQIHVLRSKTGFFIPEINNEVKMKTWVVYELTLKYITKWANGKLALLGPGISQSFHSISSQNHQTGNFSIVKRRHRVPVFSC